LLVGVSSAIGTYRDPQELILARLVRRLHRVVPFDYIGVSIRDEKSNTFHRHSIDAETESSYPSDPGTALEESDAWWVYQEPEASGDFARAQHAQFCKFPRDLKKL